MDVSAVLSALTCLECSPFVVIDDDKKKVRNILGHQAVLISNATEYKTLQVSVKNDVTDTEAC